MENAMHVLNGLTNAVGWYDTTIIPIGIKSHIHKAPSPYYYGIKFGVFIDALGRIIDYKLARWEKPSTRVEKLISASPLRPSGDTRGQKT